MQVCMPMGSLPCALITGESPMRETRKQIKARLQAASLWEDYLELREQLVREGQTPKQAKRVALQQIDTHLV